MRLAHKVAGLEEFIRVAETLSFARAAESLGQSPPAVSKAIGLLERRLGVRLFHRTTRNVSLTEDGAALYARASQWVSELDGLHGMLHEEQLTGLIRIDMPVTFGRTLFIPHLATFLSMHPQVSVEVRTNDQHVNLIADGIDVALRVGTLSDSELVVKPLGRLRMATYARPQCLVQYGQPQSPKDLASHRLLAFMLPSGRTRPMMYRQEGIDVDIPTDGAVARFNNGETLTEAVVAGIGIGQLPEFHARRALQQGQLVQILAGQDAPGAPIQLVYPSRHYQPKRVVALIDFMVEQLREALVAEATSRRI
jgi:LysR family transcriptional regulator, regulator for bpeEF and oprC